MRHFESMYFGKLIKIPAHKFIGDLRISHRPPLEMPILEIA